MLFSNTLERTFLFYYSQKDLMLHTEDAKKLQSFDTF